MTNRVNVLGVGLSVLNLRTAQDAIAAAVHERRKGYICVTGVHGVMEAQAGEDFKKILNAAFLCTPDGMPMVWAGRLNGHREMARVYGPDLMLEICAWSETSGCRHFFYGGADGVAELLVQKLKSRFPRLQVAGTFTPPFRPLNAGEEKKLAEQVSASKPDILWVGLSTPKQEKFMAEFLPRLDVTLMIGVGAAFDFHSGRAQQAPRWMQRSGLEWFHRLCREPRRLGRRYLRNNPLFALKFFAQLAGLKYPTRTCKPPPPRPALPVLERARGFAGIILLVCLLAITTRSFWIDECYSARFAQQPTLTACWQLLQEIKGSDPQMPLYIFWIWTCEKFAGDSELALRAVNLFWFLPALAAVALAFAGDRRRQTAVLLAVILSPFAWYYLNEARGYTMQFSTSLILFATIVHWSRNEKNSAAAECGWAVGFALALFCLCGSSLLAMVLAGVPLLLAPAVLPPKRLAGLGRHFWPLWLATLGALFLLGLYYLWTLHSGDRGTDIAKTGWKNVAFIGYELSGFAGLGPGRLEIRNGAAAVFAPYAAGLISYGVLVAVLAVLAILDLRQRFGVKRLAAMVLAVGLPAGLVLAASAVSHFRLLGRHCSALLPVAVLLLGLGVASAWRRGLAGKILVLVFFAFYLASALSLRFAARHEKDDYRDAAATAKAALAAGKSVWWNADPNAAIYYQVPLVKTGVEENGRALWVIHSTGQSLAGAPPPDVVITSRRDVYDEAGALADFLAREHYRPVTNFTAFIVWQRGGG